MAAYCIALSGGVASGKSEVGRQFERLGVALVDADVAARDIVAPGQPALAEIVDRFGPHVASADGSLDRGRLRELIFADASARRELEAITHPRIREVLLQSARAASGRYVLVVIPLLTEGGGRASYPWLDRVLIVDAPESGQLARLCRRDRVDEILGRKMIAAQATRQQRLTIADDVIINDGVAADLVPAVRKLDALYRRLAGA